jgi:hypothetical protein
LAAWMVGCGGSAEPPAAPATAPVEPAPKEIVKELAEESEPQPGAEEGPVAQEEEDREGHGSEGGVPGGVVWGSIAAPPPPPGPTDSTQVVPSSALEAQRIAGEKNILPNEQVRLAMQRANQLRLIASLKVCVDDSGAVSNVTMLKSTGYPSYDELLQATIASTWMFQPFVLNGRVLPVCTAVTFIYKQVP